MTSIVDLEDMAAALKLHESDTAGLAALQGYVNAITPAIEQYKKEIIVPRAVSEDLELCGRPKFWLTEGPVLSLTSLVSLDGAVTWNVANLRTSPTRLVRVMAGPNPTGVVTAVYQAGYNPIPVNYVKGAEIVLQQLWEARRGAGQSDVRNGAVGAEESRDVRYMYTFIRKAREWLGDPRPMAR